MVLIELMKQKFLDPVHLQVVIRDLACERPLISYTIEPPFDRFSIMQTLHEEANNFGILEKDVFIRMHYTFEDEEQ